MSNNWINVSSVDDCPMGSSINTLINDEQVAIFHYGKDEWYAVQNLCPHQNQMVISRGLCGDLNGEPNVACPLHKHNFSLKDGCHLADESKWTLRTFDVKIESDCIHIKT
jgi:nitrite reductase (NADH) small subunit